MTDNDETEKVSKVEYTTQELDLFATISGREYDTSYGSFNWHVQDVIGDESM